MKEEIWNELYLYLIRIEIGVLNFFKECARSPCNGNYFSSSASEAKLTNRREKFKKKYSLENRKCLEMPRAYVRPTTLMRMNNSYKMRVDDRRCPVRNVC